MDTIYVTRLQNIEFFEGKLPGLGGNFCRIERKVTLESDPSGVYGPGEYGTINSPAGRLYVTFDSVGWDIEGLKRC